MSVYYSSLKFLRFQDRLEALKKGDLAAPVHIRVKPTNRCNHNCWYCCYRTGDLTLGEEMSLQDSIPGEKMIELAHEFVEMGVKAVTFSGGGEPLLYRPLPEVIDVLANGGVKVAALTNGAFLKDAVADSFAEHGTWVRISMDAWNDASYVKSRGARPGAFSALVSNIESFIARKSNCVLGISFIVTHENHGHIFDVVTMLKRCGVNHVKVSGAVVSDNAAGNNAYHASIKDEVARQITRANDLQDESFAVLNHYHDLEELFEKRYTTCPFLQFLVVVGADQQVYTCQDKAYTASGKMGTLDGRSFRDFWFSSRNRDFLKSFNPSASCGHHCVSHTKNLAILDYLNLDEEHGYFV